jgi:hypothetical protein
VRVLQPGKWCAHHLGKLATTRLLRHVGLTRPVCPGSAQGTFFPFWLPPPCFQKSRASVLPGPNDRHDKSPTARASLDSLVSSRRTNSRTGQILRSCIIDGDCRLIFKLAAISDRLILVRSSGTSLETSKPSSRASWRSRVLRNLTLGTGRGTLDSLFSVPSSCQHQDKGWHLHQPAPASTVVSRKRGCGREIGKRSGCARPSLQEGVMAEADFPLNIDRRRLLTLAAAAVTATGWVPSSESRLWNKLGVTAGREPAERL